MAMYASSQPDLLSPTEDRGSNAHSDSDQIQSTQGEEIQCEACDPDEPSLNQNLSFCYACDFTFCETCWKAQLPHRKTRSQTSAVVHEKTNPWIAKKVQSALSPPVDESTYARLCQQDEHTAWFGIDRENRNGEPLIFHDTGRYAELMASTKDERKPNRQSWNFDWNHSNQRDTRTPSLVSFVGQSGAGKSTLINLLITFKGGANKKQLPLPVVGMTGRDLPTSEDVHLYSDPSTYFLDNPLLYADCEGLDGGEREPVKSRFRKAKLESHHENGTNDDHNGGERYNSVRQLMWADSPERRSRQFAVAYLYPRLLFTFSDTIVFVLKNPRVIEGVFERLLEWAAAALETSSNQPVLPCAIIALNASEITIEPELWDVETATTNLLKSLQTTVNKNAAFQKYADFWKTRNRQIDTLEQLILCYYSSIQIIRIPAAGRPKLIQEQVEKLYATIENGCKLVRERKRSLRMLLDAAELQSYLQCAFDHFAMTLDVAFDFVQASFINNPIPFDFGGNILRMAISIMERQTPKHGRPDPRTIFQELSALVASCIMLDSVRHDIRGNAERIFPEYINHLDSALEDFCDRHWPCEFVAFGAEYPLLLQHLDGITAHRNVKYIAKKSQCINVRAGHGSKGHQTEDGTIFHSGDYVSDFTWDTYHEEFHAAVYFRLEHLMKLLDHRVKEGESAENAAVAVHRENTLMTFYGNLKNTGTIFQSHSVCLCCLFEQPEHTLPCGHILCSSCIKSFGRMKNKTLVEIQNCPLEADSVGRYKPSTVYLKPENAGFRVLVLDSGGIRGVVQLEVLRLLEREWNGKIPIRYFFDLMVGTGTGGLIALGLGKCHWSLDKCIYYFERICNESYARRAGRGIPGIGRLLEAYSRSKYDSSALDSVLREAFLESPYLFGGRSYNEMPTSSIKVAVTATSPTGMPIVFADYNRRCNSFIRYQFCRPDKLEQEMKVWEVARATMATPKLFRSFRHLPSKQIYTAADIAMRNPITIADKERKFLSSQVESESCPDLLLSLGTGMDGERLQSSSASIRSAAPSFVGSITSFASRGDPLKRASSPTRCQMTSDDFINSLPSSANPSRFIRYNPITMLGLPVADDLSKMKQVQSLAKAHMDMRQIKRIADKLLATLFYFETIEDVKDHTAQGYILCRLPNGTPEIGNLGKLIREKASLTPQFVVRESGQEAQHFDIIPKVTEEMILSQQFRMPPIEIVLSHRLAVLEISLRLEGDEIHCISGFPRTLAKVERRAIRHRQAIAAGRPGTTLGTILSSSGSSIYSRSSKSWSPPDPERHASIWSAMSLTTTVETESDIAEENFTINEKLGNTNSPTIEIFPPTAQIPPNRPLISVPIDSKPNGASIMPSTDNIPQSPTSNQDRRYIPYRPQNFSPTLPDSSFIPSATGEDASAFSHPSSMPTLPVRSPHAIPNTNQNSEIISAATGVVEELVSPKSQTPEPPSYKRFEQPKVIECWEKQPPEKSMFVSRRESVRSGPFELEGDTAREELEAIPVPRKSALRGNRRSDATGRRLSPVEHINDSMTLGNLPVSSLSAEERSETDNTLLELRLKKLEDLVRKLEADNANRNVI